MGVGVSPSCTVTTQLVPALLTQMTSELSTQVWVTGFQAVLVVWWTMARDHGMFWEYSCEAPRAVPAMNKRQRRIFFMVVILVRFVEILRAPYGARLPSLPGCRAGSPGQGRFWRGRCPEWDSSPLLLPLVPSPSPEGRRNCGAAPASAWRKARFRIPSCSPWPGETPEPWLLRVGS